MLRVMTPLWGTKHSSALVGAKSGGDGRATRLLLSCALWRGMGRLWRGMGGRPPLRQQRLSVFHETRNTRHESRLLRPFGSPWVREGWRHQKPPSGPLPPPASQCFPVHHCSRLFTIVRHCSVKKYCPAPVPSYRPVAAFLRVVARHGAAMERHGRHGAPRATVRAPSSPATGPFGFSRNTRHETRITAFSRMLRP